MTLFLTVLHVLACLFLIVIVLLQRGKGAEMGAVFGGGAGATVFGSRGAGNFLTRMTTAAAGGSPNVASPAGRSSSSKSVSPVRSCAT